MDPSNNPTTCTTSASLFLSNPSSISSHHLFPISRNQTSTSTHAQLLPSQSYNSVSPLQQEYRDSYLHPFQSQILSQDEWNLILPLRMMQNLTVLPSFQQPYSLVRRHTNDSTPSPAISSSYQSGNQITTPTLTAPSYLNELSSNYPYPPFTTALQSLLNAQEIQNPIEKIQRLLSTGLSSLSTDKTPSSLPIITKLPSSLSSSVSAALTTNTSSLSPDKASSLSLPVATELPSLSLVSATSLSSSSGDQNNSLAVQLQSKSPTSPRVIISLPVQQQKVSTSYSPASQQCQSAQSNLPTTYQYDALIAGPTVRLLDPTKPYKNGDKLKVGGRTLQSDMLSIKYWVDDDITITETTAGGHILHMAGYSYFSRNYGKNFTTWECERRRKHHCSSIVIRSSDPIVKNYFRIYSIQGEHIHAPTPENIESRRFKQRIRDRCRQELSSPRTIYEDELLKGKYSTEMLALLPTFYNMQAQLYRIRQEHLPTLPTDSNFILHEGFMTTDKVQRFLLYDSNAVQAPYPSASSEVGRLLIYASDLQLNILSRSCRIGSDGTFETTAQISQQNYILMGEVDETHPVPLVFCLCERKTYETYLSIIQILKISIKNSKLVWNPDYWMSDFESGLIRAINEEFPKTQLLGCTFHYCQAIYRNIQSKGLQEAYQNIDKVQQILRHIMALAFIPYDQIRTVYFDIIKPELSDIPAKPSFLRQNMRSFFKYYESYWLTRIHKFCVFDQPSRTNNGLEGYNNKMTGQLTAHPHLYRLIVWFEKEELLVQQLVSKLNSDKPVHKRKQTALTILINDSLQHLWDSYKAEKLGIKELLFESSRWIAKKKA